MSQPHVPFLPAKGTGRKLTVFFHGFTGGPDVLRDVVTVAQAADPDAAVDVETGRTSPAARSMCWTNPK